MNHPLPEAFQARIQQELFPGLELLQALDTPSPISVRFHPKKHYTELDVRSHVSWCESAVYLNERPQYVFDPLFHAGAYYPQEAGSMVLDAVLRQLKLPNEPHVLDLCAAPGGKSTLIASFLDNKGLLVANEVIQQRARILKENLTKWGYSNTVVTNNDPADFQRLPQFFDLMVVDAPCSGEGMFRKDPAARDEWSEDNVRLCSGRQKRIVMDVWDTLVPGGLLVYSTCTFNTSENEDNVRWFMDEVGAELVPIELPEPIVQGRNGVGYYCIPGITETEGFFIAVLQKPDEALIRQRHTRKSEFRAQKDTLDCEKYADLSESDLINWNDKILALPRKLTDSMLHVQAQLRLQKLGTMVGEISRKGIIPNEELALNPFLNCYTERIEVTKEQSLHFLRGDTFPLLGEHGYQLITFENEPLGWIKHIGNRFNNLYPKEWRIRKQF
jgi:16S rRNA C967 or C1407 C5-methylase (RsmB/RsmF family)/NOL1/NOP2/fmu family ribosome biogenesis protein